VGGERVMRISPIAERLLGRGHQQIAAARAAGEVLRKKVDAARAQRADVEVSGLERHGAALERAVAGLTRLELELDETQDSGQLAPLTDLARRVSQAEQAVAAAAPRPRGS
jgi:hypothetical protein